MNEFGGNCKAAGKNIGRSINNVELPQCPPHNPDEERGSYMPWVKFAICFFLGFLGVHKFLEKKIGMGFLYMVTFGLFGIGWLYDCVRYLIAAIKSTNGLTTKKLWLWGLSACFLLAAFAYLTEGSFLTGILAAAVSLLLIPINGWQSVVGKCIKGKMKPILAVVLALLCFASAPEPQVSDVVCTVPTTVATEFFDTLATEATTVPTSEVVTEPTTAPTAESVTEPITAPTTEPATEPIIEPITEPTTEPVTELTTESTAAPTTQPAVGTTESTKDDGWDYVVNTNTGKFHYPSCSSADEIKSSNRWDYHGTREELINMGYVPCKRCDP